MLRAALENANYTIAAVSLGVSILTLFSMTKIWTEAFWKPMPAGSAATDGGDRSRKKRDLVVMTLPVVGLATLTVLIGLLAGPMAQLAMAAAEQLLNPTDYVQIVLGDRS